jgi:hypothetical protein
MPAGEASLARAPRRRRAAAAEVPSPTVPVEEIEAAARTEAQELLGEIEANGGNDSRGGAKVVRRFSAGGGARQPRWMTAGKARRGRLK